MRIFALVILLFTSISGFCAGASMEFLTHTLELSDEQASSVSVIMKQQHAEHKKLRRNGKPTCEAMSALRANTRTQLGSILDSTQLSKYDEMMQRRQRGCQARATYGGSPVATAD